MYPIKASAFGLYTLSGFIDAVIKVEGLLLYLSVLASVSQYRNTALFKGYTKMCR